VPERAGRARAEKREGVGREIERNQSQKARRRSKSRRRALKNQQDSKSCLLQKQYVLTNLPMVKKFARPLKNPEHFQKSRLGSQKDTCLALFRSRHVSLISIRGGAAHEMERNRDNWSAAKGWMPLCGEIEYA
jgi:hypothetical protein